MCLIKKKIFKKFFGLNGFYVKRYFINIVYFYKLYFGLVDYVKNSDWRWGSLSFVCYMCLLVLV